jgi:hypothetical protein
MSQIRWFEVPRLDFSEAVWLETALGPDGFTIAFFFFFSCWTIVKDDLMSVFHNFHEHEMFEKSLNATLLLSSLRRLDSGKLGTLDLSAWWGVFIRSWRKFLLVD